MRPIRVLAVLAGACLVGCSDSPSEPVNYVFASPIAAMRVEPEILNVAPGDSGMLTAHVTTGAGNLTGTYYINRPEAGGYYVDSLDIPGVTLDGVATLFDSSTVFEFDTVLYVAGVAQVHRASRMTDTILFSVVAGTAPDSAELALHGQYEPAVPGYSTLDFSAAFRFTVRP